MTGQEFLDQFGAAWEESRESQRALLDAEERSSKASRGLNDLAELVAREGVTPTPQKPAQPQTAKK